MNPAPGSPGQGQGQEQGQAPPGQPWQICANCLRLEAENNDLRRMVEELRRDVDNLRNDLEALPTPQGRSDAIVGLEGLVNRVQAEANVDDRQ